MRLAFITLLLLMSLPPFGIAKESEQIEFIYVNANVGAAAGGHTALRLGEDVFHYQFFPNKRFLLVRESWDHFKLIYTRLRNRSIFTAVCRVDSLSYRRIKDNFVSALGAQSYDLYRERLLREQQRLLHNLGKESLSVEVAALVFFDRSKPESHAAVTLRDIVCDSLGENFIAKQRMRVRKRLDNLAVLAFEETTDSDKRIALLIELGDIKKKLTALEVLEKGVGLTDSALVGDPRRPELREETVQALEEYLDCQVQSLLDLLVSARPDFGEALLLQLARCQAIMASMASGSLLTLDPYLDDAQVKTVDPDDHEMKLYMAQRTDIYLKNRDILLDLFADSEIFSADLLYNMLENINGKLSELSQGINSGNSVRVAHRLMSPSRMEVVTEPLTVARVTDFTPLEEQLGRRQYAYSKNLADKYYYRLITKNCVNELLRTINSSFVDSASVENGLGAYINPDSEWVIVPHDLFERVVSSYRVVELHHFPSRRWQELESLSENINHSYLWFQEGNTLRSTLYTPRVEDTPFLFFTDDQSWARPLLGVGNLGWATIYCVGGIFQLFTGDIDPLYQGLRGMFYSLPELVFANIRKGTYLYEDLSGDENNL